MVHPSYVPPGRTYFAKNVLEPMYLSTKEVIKEKVKNLPEVGLQLDQWTSTSQYPHGDIYATWISQDFEIHNVNLGTFSFTGIHHSADSIFNSVDALVNEYNLQNSKRYYITDNHSSCKGAFQGGRLGCFAHTLHLIVEAGLNIDEVSDLHYRLCQK